MISQNIADVLIEELVDAKVKRIYGLIGDSLNPIGEAVRKNGQLEWVSVRHEETAAFAAGAEAELTDELCVCAGTAGPGSIHLINGLYEANRNNVPLLAIVTNFISSQAGLSYFQATSPMQLYKDCSIFCETLSNVAQMPRLLQEAMQTAISNKGVAVLIIPRDISESLIGTSAYKRVVQATPSYLIPQESEVQKLADILNKHHKITFYCGIGCKNAVDEVRALAQTLNAPTVSTLRSKYFMERDNPNNVGMNGMISLYESKYALDNCEVLVLLGTDFPFNGLIPTHAFTIQVDIAAKHLGRRSRLDFGLHADIKSTLKALLPLLKPKENDDFLQQSLKYMMDIETQKYANVENMANIKTLNPEYLTHKISQLAADDTIFVVDVGLNDIWACRYLKALGNRTIIGSFKHATMAAAIPMAIGATYAYPKRQVIALAGDGGLTMLMGELLTVIQNQRKLVIVVYNNAELGFIKKEAQQDKITPYAISLQNPDFAKLAADIGFKTYQLKKPQDVEKTLLEALEYDGPVLIDALTNPESLG